MNDNIKFNKKSRINKILNLDDNKIDLMLDEEDYLLRKRTDKLFIEKRNTSKLAELYTPDISKIKELINQINNEEESLMTVLSKLIMYSEMDNTKKIILQLNPVEKLLTNIFNQTNLNNEVLKNTLYLISIICDKKLSLSDKLFLKNSIKILIKYLSTDDENILHYSLYIIAFTQDLYNKQISKFLIKNELQNISNLLNSNFNDDISLIILRILGNMIFSSNRIKNILNPIIFERFKYFLIHPNPILRKQTALNLSNIACGNLNDLKELLNHGFFSLVIKCFNSDIDFSVKKELAHILVNMTNNNHKEIKLYLIENDIYNIIINLLYFNKKTLILLGLEGLRNILSIDDINIVNKVINQLEIMGVYDRLEELQESEDEEIYQSVFTLISEFFNMTLI